MKKMNLPFLSIILIASVQVCFAQVPTRTTKATNQAFYVLKADSMTVVVDNTEGDKSEIVNDIDANKITTIEVLKNAEAVAKYGENARSGAVIISFRDFDSLSETTKKLFEKNR